MTRSNALKYQRALLAIAIALALFFHTSIATPKEFDSPEALVLAWANLKRSDCDFECFREIADMYSERFLNLNKTSMVATLRSSADRANDSRILLGKNISQRKLEKMTPTDVYSHQIMHMGRSAPSEYRYSKTEIIKKRAVSENEMYFTVRNSGLKAAPQSEEEEIIHVVKEGGKWDDFKSRKTRKETRKGVGDK